MPEPTIKRRLANTRDRGLADDEGPIFSTVAKLVDALQRAIPHRAISNCGMKPCALGANCCAGPSTRRSDEEVSTQPYFIVPLRFQRQHVCGNDYG
jgi:hypothetical protein